MIEIISPLLPLVLIGVLAYRMGHANGYTKAQCDMVRKAKCIADVQIAALLDDSRGGAPVGQTSGTG